MINFHVDKAGFHDEVVSGTINYFDGWVINIDRSNPVQSVRFSLGDHLIGSLPIRKERPDLEQVYGQTLLGFSGVIDVPPKSVGASVKLVAEAKNGNLFGMDEFCIVKELSDEELRFRRDNKLPDDVLIHLVAHNVDPKTFLEEGKAGVELIKRVLTGHQIHVDALVNILDFGVGCGRVLRWWKDDSQSTVFYGTDINNDLIGWCKENIDFGEFSVNTLHPPASFRGSQFDLVYAFSVFTHLRIETQLEWILEFYRIVAPSRYLLLSIHGDHHAKLLSPSSYEEYVRNGYCVLSKDAEGENLCAAYQSRSFTENLFGRYFEVIEFFPAALKSCGDQDLYFFKTRKIRDKCYLRSPEWSIEDIQWVMPPRYLLSGGFPTVSLQPGVADPIRRALDAMLSPWSGSLAMCAFIRLRRA